MWFSDQMVHQITENPSRKSSEKTVAWGARLPKPRVLGADNLRNPDRASGRGSCSAPPSSPKRRAVCSGSTTSCRSTRRPARRPTTAASRPASAPSRCAPSTSPPVTTVRVSGPVTTSPPRVSRPTRRHVPGASTVRPRMPRGSSARRSRNSRPDSSERRMIANAIASAPSVTMSLGTNAPPGSGRPSTASPSAALSSNAVFYSSEAGALLHRLRFDLRVEYREGHTEQHAVADGC